MDYDYVKALTQMIFTCDEVTNYRDRRQKEFVITLLMILQV